MNGQCSWWAPSPLPLARDQGSTLELQECGVTFVSFGIIFREMKAGHQKEQTEHLHDNGDFRESKLEPIFFPLSW